jgi:hypothetical protein
MTAIILNTVCFLFKMRIEPLGYNCEITIALQKLHVRGASGVFEWFLSESFSEVIDVLERVVHAAPVVCVDDPLYPGNIVYEGTRIRSSHYTLADFQTILPRRMLRLTHALFSQEPVLLVREEPSPPSDRDIARLVALMDTVSPNVKILILCQAPIPLSTPRVIYRPNKADYTVYIKELYPDFQCTPYIHRGKLDKD